jgi:competence protein ComEC
MLLFTFAFLSGDLFLQTFSYLPNRQIFFVLVLILLLLKKYRKLVLMLFAFILGFYWTNWFAASLLSWQLPKHMETRPVLATGYIASIPAVENQQTNFVFFLKTLQIKQDSYAVNRFIKLSWRQPVPDLNSGDQWQLWVRLKRIHGVQNPGGFDYEAWALQNQLRAAGYVITQYNNRKLSHDWFHYPMNQVRQLLQKKIVHDLPQISPWLIALIIGERQGVPAQDWQILRRTGTNHLMAIAGLHIGIIAGFVFLLTSIVWKRIPYLLLKLPAQQAGWCAAFMAAIAYSALAGFSIPTQRACLMLSIFFVIFLLKRKLNPWNSWSLAVLIVLFINPLSVLTQSFWLSFGTIALIIYCMNGRLSPRGLWWKHGRIQWIIGVGLIPISLLLFQECSFISFIANTIAIPWLGFLILPLCFASAICYFIFPWLGKLLLIIADKNLALLWMILHWLSELKMSFIAYYIPDYFIFISILFAFIFLLYPAGFPGRWLGILWLLPLFSYQTAKPAHGEVWLTVLDVGQGLATVVQTQSHLLVYDTGAKFLEHDMGESVVLPFLRTLQAKQIDMLVISHGDNDHIGGAQSIMDHLKMKAIRTSTPEKISHTTTTYCLTGQAWHWDGVDFKFIYPTAADLHLGNDSSCVLRISNQQHTILLSGDIEKYAEKKLMTSEKDQLAADILLAPHHGSKTSGLADFIAAVHPAFVIYATGYLNRYHFPHASIVQSYSAISAQQLNTAETGAIQFKLNPKLGISVESYRVKNKHFWYDM